MRAQQGIAALVAAATLAATGCQLAQGHTPPAAELLKDYVPHVRYDRHEEFFATSVAALAEEPASRLRDASGRVITRPSKRSYGLSLGFLGRQSSNGDQVSMDDTVTVASSYQGWAARLRDQRRYGDVVYSRSVQGRDGRIWLQYWFFYVFQDSGPALGHDNPPATTGDHEGDWELVEIKLDERGRTPDLVVYSQDKGARKMRWGQVAAFDGHPELYPARGTHAGMFGRGCHRADTSARPDCSDGDGPAVTPTLKSLDQPWAAWPGMWGASPAPCTRPEWGDPDALGS